MSNRKTGNLGEKIALQFLERAGLNLLEANWRSGRCEIDLIMQENATIVFIEVKTRNSNMFGWPEESVKPAKQKNILKTAEAYLFEKDLDTEIRFDIVSILFTNGKPDVYHIRDAFTG